MMQAASWYIQHNLIYSVDIEFYTKFGFSPIMLTTSYYNLSYAYQTATPLFSTTHLHTPEQILLFLSTGSSKIFYEHIRVLINFNHYIIILLLGIIYHV
jgi:hypothetical protein